MNKLLRINYAFFIGVFMVASLLILAIFGAKLAPHSLTEMFETYYADGKVYAPPLVPFENKDYPLGTDKWGYDLLSMVLNGIRHTIFISLIVTMIKMTIGSLIGLYVGTLKKTPTWLESFENSWSYIPLFLVLYFFFLPINFDKGLSGSTLILYFIIVTSILSIPSIISSVRKKTVEVSKSIFIEAAIVLGANRHRIIWKHIFPQMKESLLVMFVLEIVYVVTIMGQLALMKIFIGGTTVRYDPLIYLSVTKELSGLVGQARGNIYGSTHVLIVPLIVLLITTLSFTLLANGLKNRYQSNYQKSPWIKTGIDPKFAPVRKKSGKTHWWSLSGEKLLAVLSLLALFGVGGYMYTTFAAEGLGQQTSKAKGVVNGSQANYDLSIKLNKEGEFFVTANIEVKNKAKKNWDELIFYFIPNLFTEGNSHTIEKGFSKIELNSLKVDGQAATYSLKDDTLQITLAEELQKGEKAEVEVSYRLKLPVNGNGLSQVGNQYYLAQWYPMLATFQNGKWNKEGPMGDLRSYHTDFANFAVKYEIPKGFSLVSTADDHVREGNKMKGTLKAERVREFYMAIFKDLRVYSTKVNNVEIRLFSKKGAANNPEENLRLAKKALGFFQSKIGKYPHKQLDIIIAKGSHGEYPGVVTIDPSGEPDEPFNYSLVRGVAHQYFSEVVANDPYHEAWIGEGFSEFAANVYFYLGEGQGKYIAQGVSYNRISFIQNTGLGRQPSNVSLAENNHIGYISGQPAVQLFTMAEDKAGIRKKNSTVVLTEYLSDYYHHFLFKEVDTKGFVQFTKDYYQVPTGYFNEWLDTSKIE